jgi:protein TonB
MSTPFETPAQPMLYDRASLLRTLPLSILSMKRLVAKRRPPPLISGTLLAVLLHALLFALLMLKLTHAPTPRAEPRRLTIIELQPQLKAPAAALLPSPPPPPPKQIASHKPAPKRITPPPLLHPSDKLIATIPPPAPPKPVIAPVKPLTPPLPTAAAAPPTPAAPPVTASSGHVSPIPFEYLMEVATTIDMYRIYPMSAKDAHQQGAPVIDIYLRRDGTVIRASLRQSCGYKILDDAAVAEILRIGKFPPLPSEYAPGDSSFAIYQPVNFKLASKGFF